MHVVYAREPLPTTMTKSIFLAGPTPRSKDVFGWRDEAMRELARLGYDGHVFVPEPADGRWEHEYDPQVEWEEAALNVADCIVFWIPRDLRTMPGFTTNDEWGFWKNSGKVVLGCPTDAEKVSYQRHYAKKFKVPYFDTLNATLKAAVERIGTGALRHGAETQVPLYVWRHGSFKSWYLGQKAAGNSLEAARVLWTFRVGAKPMVFAWVLHVSVHVASENRVKSNEFVFGRPDISTMVLWNRAETLSDTRVVLVREFRSPARTPDGCIHEFPGGSTTDTLKDSFGTALEELREETGFTIDPARVDTHDFRQMAGTLSSFGAFVYSAEITNEELALIEWCSDVPRGVKEDSEQTYVEVVTVGELISEPKTDWATLGMLFAVLSKATR